MNFARAPSRDAAHPVTGPEGERLRLPGGRPGGFVCLGSKVVPTRSKGCLPEARGCHPGARWRLLRKGGVPPKSGDAPKEVGKPLRRALSGAFESGTTEMGGQGGPDRASPRRTSGLARSHCPRRLPFERLGFGAHPPKKGTAPSARAPRVFLPSRSEMLVSGQQVHRKN